VAAFIAEPVVGAALGCVPPPDGYFEIIRDICDRHDVLFIADEVMTAWGRIGHWFGMEEWGVTPDIIATAKGITSGYATMAATLAREEIWQAIEDSGTPFVAGHTMNQNPISAAAAVANLRYMEEQDLLTNSREVGAYLLERLGELREFPIVGDVRGLGMMCGIELVKDQQTKEPFAPEQKASVVLEREALKRGLILYACSGCIEGAAGDMLEVTPPLVMTREQVDEMMDILREAIPATAKALSG
jgi:adenosylmethionine-8-amino-7-oxononanoate aminotransferase